MDKWKDSELNKMKVNSGHTSTNEHATQQLWLFYVGWQQRQGQGLPRGPHRLEPQCSHQDEVELQGGCLVQG